jgi:sulfur-oxidizing protein SoxB
VGQGVTGEPIWDVVGGWLRQQKTVAPRRLNAPKLVGMDGNPGMA